MVRLLLLLLSNTSFRRAIFGLFDGVFFFLAAKQLIITISILADWIAFRFKWYSFVFGVFVDLESAIEVNKKMVKVAIKVNRFVSLSFWSSGRILRHFAMNAEYIEHWTVIAGDHRMYTNCCLYLYTIHSQCCISELYIRAKNAADVMWTQWTNDYASMRSTNAQMCRK